MVRMTDVHSGPLNDADMRNALAVYYLYVCWKELLPLCKMNVVYNDDEGERREEGEEEAEREF